MLFQRINRSNPEKVFIVVYNSYSTAALTNGQGVNPIHHNNRVKGAVDKYALG